ncbi:MAG: amidohydrolase family protein [Candidatus Omnitrophica bacterium]|nr:amidohydrolase family protein [Candidatus Omnitrophota bacterium]
MYILKILDAHIHFGNISRINETRKFFHSCGIDKICIVSSTSLSLGNSNPQALCFKATFPQDTYIMGAIDYTGITKYCQKNIRKILKQQLLKLMETGFDGVKILETKPNLFKLMPFKIDEPEYYDFFETLQEKKIPIVWHVADPPEFWDKNKIHPIALKRGWGYFSNGFPSYEEIRKRVNRVLSNFPRLKIIFAHFYFLSQDLDQAAENLEKYPLVNFDITPGAEMYVNFSKNSEKTRDFFIKYQDRIVFGTDASIREKFDRKGTREKIVFMRRFLETQDVFHMPQGDINFLSQPDKSIKGIKLPVLVLRRIYRKNFFRIVGEKPKRIDMRLAMEECSRIGKELENKLTENENFGHRALKYLKNLSRGSL